MATFFYGRKLAQDGPRNLPLRFGQKILIFLIWTNYTMTNVAWIKEFASVEDGPRNLPFKV